MARRPAHPVRAPSSEDCVQPAQLASCVRSRPADRATHNYAGDAGHGSQTFTSSETWRKALLGTAAAGALLLGYARRAYADCVGSGTAPNATLTCTGDLTGTGVASGGINVDGTVYDTLDVNNLNAPIAPSNNSINGIKFETTGDIKITSDATIHPTGLSANGIFAYTGGGGSNSVEITSTGDVTSDHRYGIVVYNYTSGDTNVENHGRVTTASGGSGISVRAYGDVTVHNFGVVNVSGGGGYGIGVRAYSGADIRIDNYAAVTGGNAGIFADASGGSVTINSTGDVTASGSAVSAIASSSTITLNSGTVKGHLDGVRISGNATLNNFASLSGDTNAVFVGGGNTTINNDGTITGNIYTGGGGAITFDNKAGGIFNSGDTANLGLGALNNYGTLSPGGTGTVQATEFTGNLVQKSGGVFSVDIDGASWDVVQVSGTADLAGTVAPNLMSFPSASELTILTTSSMGDLSANGVTVQDSVAIDYELEVEDDQNLILTINVDFAASGLNQNQTNIGEHLNGAFGAGGGGLGDLLTTLANLTSLSSFANALDQLSPEIYGDTQLAALFASLDFSSNLLSCKMNGADTAAINREGQCLWVSAKVRFLDNDQTSENIGFDETAGLFAAGAQLALDPVWRLGFGLGYQNSALETATNAQSDGDMVQGGVALKYNPGALELAGVVSGGRGWYDTTRPMAFGNFSATAEGDQEIDILSGRLHASYVLGAPSLYFKPMVDAAVTRLELGDFSETGAGAANLVVSGEDTTVFSVSPALEIGTEWWLSNGTLVRPFLRGGVTWFSDDDVTVTASFAGSPAGVSPFTIRSQVDQVQADVAAGLEMINSEDSVLRLTYDGKLGDTTQIHSVALKGSVKF